MTRAAAIAVLAFLATGPDHTAFFFRVVDEQGRTYERCTVHLEGRSHGERHVDVTGVTDASDASRLITVLASIEYPDMIFSVTARCAGSDEAGVVANVQPGSERRPTVVVLHANGKPVPPAPWERR